MPIVAIVGRPNVGKSTFFNRLTGRRDAIVDEESGVTRDRHYGQSDWNGISFSVIDTGGYIHKSDDVFEAEIKKQVRLAIDEADCILFMVDVKEGLTGMDEDLAKLLRQSKKKVFLVANKVDSHKQVHEIHEFHRLGLGDVYSISAMNGSGTGDLLDDVVGAIRVGTIRDGAIQVGATLESPLLPELPKIAIIGRPNAGKSSLVNVLLGNERAIVTPLPGTTRDAINSHYKYAGFEFILIDTAGIRQKSKVKEDIEFYSVMRAIRSIESSDICMLIIDAERGFEAQDLNIFSLVEKNHKGIVILVNKWDLVEKDSNTHKQFEALIRERIAPFRDVPIVFTSVIEKQRIYKAVETTIEVFKNRSRRITTSVLNETLLPLIQALPPPSVKGKYLKIKYITQLPTSFPCFVFFCNNPVYVKESYKRFLENSIRERFNFTGVPVEIYFRQK